MKVGPALLFFTAITVFLPSIMSIAHGLTSGVIKEIVSNDKMEIFVVNVRETDIGVKKQVEVEVILKNLNDKPGAFNVFFAKVVDSNGNEAKANALISSVIPVRIPSNDIIRGFMSFLIDKGASANKLIWKEVDGSDLVVDLTRINNPPSDIPESEWVLSSNKGITLADGNLRLTLNNELLGKIENFHYYLVDISLENIGTETISYSTVFFFVKDQDGYLYPPDVKDFQLMNRPLKKGELKVGEEVRGEILFQLRDSADRVMLIYDELLGGGSYFAIPEFPSFLFILMSSLAMLIVLGNKFATVRIRERE